VSDVMKNLGRRPRLPDPLPDFSKRESFPGLDGNPFDIILHGLERLQMIPPVLFLLGLVILALLSAYQDFWRAAIVLSFMLGDWFLLAQLPVRNKSFGPAQPPTFLLAICRAVVAVFPLPISLFIQIVATGLVFYSTWIEPHHLRVTHQELHTSKLPVGIELRILHLGDLHLEHTTTREQQLKAEINKLKPDLIVFSGDFLNLSFLKDAQAHLEARSLFAEWKAPLGTYAVTGSPAVDLPAVIPEIFHDDDLTFLMGRRITLQKNGSSFDLIGLACTHRPHQDGEVLRKLIPSAPETFTILLYHSPDLAPQAANLGADLQLSGHTHGGQIRLPLLGAIFTGSLFGRAFEAGRYQIQQLTLYITRGIGMEGAGAPRARFLCPPEIILWEIND